MSLTRADGTVTADWPAVSGAAKYHVTYTTDGGSSWHAPVNNHTNITANILTFNADNAKSYIVGVRAGNDHGWSGWRNSPQAGPYTPPQPTATPTPQPDPTPTPTPEPEPTATPTPEPEPTATPTPEPQPTATPTPQPQAPAAPTGVSATGGDQTVTLAWNNPGDASVTGYQFRVNHTNTSTGKLSGWGQWWNVPNSGADTTSYTLGGLANGKEYRFKLRAVNAAGESKPGPQSAPWYVSATPQKPPPPAAPSNVAVNPGEDYLEITWDAVSDATGYDVRAKAQGASGWHDVASGVTGTSYTYTTSNTMDYVGVRARNANGASAWTDVSRMPADDLLNVATGLSSGGASAQSVQSQSTLDAPTWGTIELGWEYQTRTTLRAELDLNWTGSSGATGYNLVCSDTERGGWDWYICGWVDATNSNTVTYTSVPSGQSQPVTVSHYRRTSENFHPPGDYHLVYGRPVAVAIRAVNANPADASAWASTPIIRNVLPDLSDFTVTRTDGQLSMSWTPNKWTTGYKVYCDTYTAGLTPSYTLCATLTNQDDTAASHSVTITKSGGTHNWSALDNTSILDIAIDSTNGWDTGRFVAPLIHPVTLTASNVGAMTATLTIANHNAAWYYKYTVPATPAGTCSTVVAAGTTTATLDTLTAGTAYTFKAYSDSSCTTELATATFTTPASLTASNVVNTTATLTIAGHSGAWYYKANAAPDNTCKGPVNAGTKTKDLTGLSGNTTYTYEAYSDSACTTANKLATAQAFTTLSSASTMSSTSSGDDEISVNKRQAVAFTTGADSAATGYVLKSITVPLKAVNPSGGRDGLQLKLYAISGTYSTTSAPSGNALATLSGTAPTGSTYTNTTWTCSGSGCNLSKDTTYFVVATYDGSSGQYQWSYATTETQTLSPTNNGWDIEYSHYKDGPAHAARMGQLR